MKGEIDRDAPLTALEIAAAVAAVLWPVLFPVVLGLLPRLF